MPLWWLWRSLCYTPDDLTFAIRVHDSLCGTAIGRSRKNGEKSLSPSIWTHCSASFVPSPNSRSCERRTPLPCRSMFQSIHFCPVLKLVTYPRIFAVACGGLQESVVEEDETTVSPVKSECLGDGDSDDAEWLRETGELVDHLGPL